MTPGTARLSQQTQEETWVSAPEVDDTELALDEDSGIGEEADGTTPYWEASIPKKTKWQIDHKSLANDEFYEADPFLEAEAEDEDFGQEVGEADIEEAWEEEAAEEEEPLVPVLKVAEIRRDAATGAKLTSKVGVPKPAKVDPPKLAAPKAVAPKADWELFKAVKVNEADTRDTGAKAVCRVKHLLRQPGAQGDGKPCVPPDWDTRFKPMLGAFKRFILTRPDQFRIITGAEPGKYTVAIVPQKIVQAPDKGKGKKGKDKGKDKGKGKGKGKDGKGKSWDDGKGKGKPWGKSWGKGKKDKDGKDKGQVPWTGAQAWGSGVQAIVEPVETEKVAPPTRAVRLLAAAARDALAEEVEEKEQEEAPEGAGEDGEVEAEDPEFEWPADEEAEEEAPDEDPIEKLYKPAPVHEEPEVKRKPDAEEDEDDFDSSSQHGRFISSLLTGLGTKRPRLVA